MPLSLWFTIVMLNHCSCRFVFVLCMLFAFVVVVVVVVVVAYIGAGVQSFLPAYVDGGCAWQRMAELAARQSLYIVIS